jgi:hypothetical protein
MGMPFGKASGRTFKRMGIIPCRNRNSLLAKSSDTGPFPDRSPSEALKGGISMSAFGAGALTLIGEGDLKNAAKGGCRSDSLKSNLF